MQRETGTATARHHGPRDLDGRLGAWAIGGEWAHGWGPQDDAVSIAAIRHAVDLGVNWINTAAIYGLGHSEEVVGRALHDIPPDNRPFIFTKGGVVPDPGRLFDEPVRNLDPASIRREVEASLARLGVDRINLYQFHWPDQTGTPIEDSWAEMAAFSTRQNSRCRRLQLRRGAARECRGSSPRRLAAAAVLAHPARLRGRCDSLGG